jgi:hypothetical protein
MSPTLGELGDEARGRCLAWYSAVTRVLEGVIRALRSHKAASDLTQEERRQIEAELLELESRRTTLELRRLAFMHDQASVSPPTPAQLHDLAGLVALIDDPTVTVVTALRIASLIHGVMAAEGHSASSAPSPPAASAMTRSAPPPPPRMAPAGPPPASKGRPPRAERPAPATRGIRGARPSPRGARRTMAKPARAEPRWILARVFDLSGRGRPTMPTPAYRANAEHEVEVMIGAEQADFMVARGPSATDSIDSMLPAGQTHELTVAFLIPALGVQQMGKLTLPPTGPTPRSTTFRFTAGPAGTPIEALINLIHRGRILQTAILSGRAVADPARAPADAALALRLQIVVPGLGDLERREPFDATMVVTRRADGGAAATAVPDAAPGVVFDQPQLDAAVQGIRDSLRGFVDDPAAFKGRLDSPASVALLRGLANAGVVLHRAIGQRIAAGLPGRDLTRLQIVQIDPTAFIPIEFVYDLPAPANDAGLCKNWRKALAGARCAPEHHPVDDVLGDLEVVCPSGFWSISKVIERQVVKEVAASDLKGGRFAIRAEPSTERPRLAAPSAALFAWSEILDRVVPGTSVKLLKLLNGATGNHAVSVKTWRDWAVAISQRRPPLLVLLSHTTDDTPAALEIGPEPGDRPERAERRALGQVNDKLVKGNPEDTPVLFLLGCDTAIADRALSSFVAGFRDAGAAVVVGTITPVHGELAAAVVGRLVQALVAAAKQKTAAVRFGELMRNGRRQLLAEGQLTALCAASFGDADWLVGGKGA